jgi:hypothetical protein
MVAVMPDQPLTERIDRAFCAVPKSLSAGCRRGVWTEPTLRSI